MKYLDTCIIVFQKTLMGNTHEIKKPHTFVEEERIKIFMDKPLKYPCYVCVVCGYVSWYRPESRFLYKKKAYSNLNARS